MSLPNSSDGCNLRDNDQEISAIPFRSMKNLPFLCAATRYPSWFPFVSLYFPLKEIKDTSAVKFDNGTWKLQREAEI